MANEATPNQTTVRNGTRTTHFWVFTGLLIALGVLVPMLFHQFGIAGKVFLPIQFPVVIAGLLFGPLSGLLVGLLSVTLGFLLTGMPPFPTIAAMVPELMTYGIVSGWLYVRLRANLWISLLSAMVAGRIMLGLAWWLMANILGFHAEGQRTVLGLVILGVTIGLPGIIGQLILIPLLVKRIPSYLGRASKHRQY